MSLFFIVVFFFLKTLNCDVCKIKLKLGVCTVNAQYVVAGPIKRRFSTAVRFDLSSLELSSSDGLEEVLSQCLFCHLKMNVDVYLSLNALI